jgi:hypothetical protein
VAKLIKCSYIMIRKTRRHESDRGGAEEVIDDEKEDNEAEKVNRHTPFA